MLAVKHIFGLLLFGMGIFYLRALLGPAAYRIVLTTFAIGSGIFRSPAAIATRLPSSSAFIAVWVVGGILALCGALTLAEVASALPRTGGI